jgi:hypothetical protein
VPQGRDANKSDTEFKNNEVDILGQAVPEGLLKPEVDNNMVFSYCELVQASLLRDQRMLAIDRWAAQ